MPILCVSFSLTSSDSSPSRDQVKTEVKLAEAVKRESVIESPIMSLEEIVKRLEEQGKTFREEFSRMDRRISRFEEISQDVSGVNVGSQN